MPSFAQSKRNWNWHFGYRGAISFRTDPPQALSGSAISTREGCASISDTAGNLLFYTNGIMVHNRNHQVMKDGDYLRGDFSTTQSATIVPKPGSTSEYYIFTLDAVENAAQWGLNYTIVDMTRDNGLGEVIIAKKNINLRKPASERIAAVRHANCRDVWIIAHSSMGNTFYSYLLTENGINTQAVQSNVGFNTITEKGYLKSSPDGKLLAMASSKVEVFSFDNQTGKVSNARIADESFAYGVEFSPDNTKLYSISRNAGILMQYDLTAATASALQQSKISVSGLVSSGCLQLGSDGKIYLSPRTQRYLSVIEKPNLSGTACDFKEAALPLADLSSAAEGLPTIYYDCDDFKNSFTWTGACTGEFIRFHLKYESDALPIKWLFDDPNSGSADSSVTSNPAHIYTKAGNYEVKLIISKDTIVKTVNIKTMPRHCSDTTLKICSEGANNYTLDAGNPGCSYLWNTGQRTQTINVNKSGWYFVTTSNGECIIRDSFKVIFYPKQNLKIHTLPFDCRTRSFTLFVSDTLRLHQWNNGWQGDSLRITQSGLYGVTGLNPHCPAGDTVEVHIPQPPSVRILPDSFFLCSQNGDSIRLRTESIGNLLWQPGNHIAREIYVSRYGSYRLIYTDDHGCMAADSIFIRDSCISSLYVPNSFSPTANGQNDIFKAYGYNIRQFHLQIYNRWGERLFETHDINEGWDGRFQGAEAPEGVYLYVISFTGLSGRQMEKGVRKGTLHLFR